jgi:mediator of replication checkpoint protein 1
VANGREKDREQDEKFVQGLMHDLRNGGLRRRRGGAMGLGDWESDEDDDAEERRRRWELRREEMKRRMLEDETLGKLGKHGDI